MSIVSAKMLTKVYAGKIQAVDNLDLERSRTNLRLFRTEWRGKDYDASYASNAVANREWRSHCRRY